MVFGLAIHASAVGDGTLAGGISGGTEGTVKVTVSGVAEEAAKTYYVVVEWVGLTFSYNFNESKNTWDAVNHKTETTLSGTPGWDHTEASITVTNHSNDDITVAAAFEDDGKENGVTASLIGESKVLPSAVGKATNDSSLVASFTVKITDTAPSVKEGFTIDKVILTITA